MQSICLTNKSENSLQQNHQQSLRNLLSCKLHKREPPLQSKLLLKSCKYQNVRFQHQKLFTCCISQSWHDDNQNQMPSTLLHQQPQAVLFCGLWHRSTQYSTPAICSTGACCSKGQSTKKGAYCTRVDVVGVVVAHRKTKIIAAIAFR